MIAVTAAAMAAMAAIVVAIPVHIFYASRSKYFPISQQLRRFSLVQGAKPLPRIGRLEIAIIRFLQVPFREHEQMENGQNSSKQLPNARRPHIAYNHLFLLADAPH